MTLRILTGLLYCNDCTVGRLVQNQYNSQGRHLLLIAFMALNTWYTVLAGTSSTYTRTLLACWRFYRHYCADNTVQHNHQMDLEATTEQEGVSPDPPPLFLSPACATFRSPLASCLAAFSRLAGDAPAFAIPSRTRVRCDLTSWMVFSPVEHAHTPATVDFLFVGSFVAAGLR